jgi:hypothetical protein
MYIWKRIILPFFFLLFFTNIFAQDEINKYATASYKNSFNGGLFFHTNGWGISLQYLANRTVTKNLLFNLDITTLKHPKETKVINPNYEKARPYVFGKINNILGIRAGLGNQFILADKETPKGIRINANFVLGANFALLMPVYLEIKHDRRGYPDTTEYIEYKETEKYDPENDPNQDNQGNIYGGTSYFKGLFESKMAIGAFGKFGFNFEWNNFENTYKFLEVGVLVDLFPEPLPIFTYIDNKYLYLNFYLNLSLGKRW